MIEAERALMELTNGQVLLWTGQQLHPAAPLYNMALAFDISGPLDPSHFERAWRALLEGSDALRTRFHDVDGLPRQRVNGVPGEALEFIDFSAQADPWTAARQWMATRAARLFDLRDRAFDCALLRLGPERAVWYLNQHHLVTDGWSTALVYRRLSELYAQSVAGSIEAGARWPLYADYIGYERRFRASAVFQGIRDHWRRKLAAPLEPIRLYGRTALRGSTRTERVTRELPAQLAGRVRALAAATPGRALTQHAALFNIFAAALFAWLYRISGQRRLAIGTPSHNRPTAAFKQTIGVFIEVLPYTVEVEDGETFQTLLDKVQSETAEFLRYAQPGTSTPEVNRGFSVLLNYIHASFPPFAGLPMRSEWIHPGHGDSAHHLRLQVHDFDDAGRFTLHFDGNTDVLDAAQREAAADQFLHVLSAALEQPDGEITGLRLHSAADARVVLERHAAAARDAGDATVVEMFSAQAARTPDAPAVQQNGDVLGYGALRQRVERLAGQLRALGVGPDVRVGLYVERSADAVAGVLAVLAAGGAFVPLSPGDPPARVQAVLRDAGASVLLTRPELASALPAGSAAGVQLDIADGASIPRIAHGDTTVEPASGGNGNDTRPGHGPSPRDAAYVIYTSGSTGRPKGVVIEHAALASYVSWARDHYGRGESLDFPLFTSLSFDLTVTSVFVPLVTGGRVVVYGEEHGGVPALLRVLEEDRVDVIKLTPSHLSLLRGARRPAGRLRMLILGGEDLRVEQAVRAREVLGDVEIFNEYGPTEATVGCMIHRFDPARDRVGSVPIGGPAAGAAVHVLDSVMQPVPDGVVGEIWVGGPGLARGYLHDPTGAAERFRAHPSGTGGRLYRTGDLARRRRDGLLEFLGRADGQLKIRGARIEPAEVEAALLEHPAVAACVVDVVAAGARGVEAAVFCTQCGLPSNYPGARYDAAGVCHLCRAFARYRERASHYFRDMDALREVLRSARARRRGEYDCVMLLSGGKDSTYALCQLVRMGASVYAFTLDNGYISEQAKANIGRVTGSLGVPHVFGTTPHMNAIFADSLQRHSNVCNGCFKTIYTLGARLARDKGIPLVITGLSRGQFFETRLSEELFHASTLDVDRIDVMILEARKAYHRAPDGVASLLDTRDFRDDALFEDVQFVDFYRYSDVRLDEMLAFLAEHVPWIRPSDTGRSTNCLINQVGIYVHTAERGFHNYAFPYSWDVRMGHKSRDAALHELNDEIDASTVQRILREIGYEPAPAASAEAQRRLVAWYVPRETVTAAELREHLRQRVPGYMVPAQFQLIEQLPLTAHGKLDRSSLPHPTTTPRPDAVHVGPRDAAEERISAIWADVLGQPGVGVTDEFLDLGGNSLLAIRIIARVNQAFGVDLALRSAFEASTVAALSRLVEEALLAQIEEMSEEDARGTVHAP